MSSRQVSFFFVTSCLFCRIIFVWFLFAALSCCVSILFWFFFGRIVFHLLIQKQAVSLPLFDTTLPLSRRFFLVSFCCIVVLFCCVIFWFLFVVLCFLIFRSCSRCCPRPIQPPVCVAYPSTHSVIFNWVVRHHFEPPCSHCHVVIFSYPLCIMPSDSTPYTYSILWACTSNLSVHQVKYILFAP
jgi:hypothetical protein